MSDRLGEPSGSFIQEWPFSWPFGEGNEGRTGVENCNTGTGWVCFDYVRTVWWENPGISLVFADVMVNPTAATVDEDYYLQVPANLRGYSYTGGSTDMTLATELGLTVGSTVSELVRIYGDKVTFGLGCGEGVEFFVSDLGLHGNLLGGDPEDFTESGKVNPEATVASIGVAAAGSC